MCGLDGAITNFIIGPYCNVQQTCIAYTLLTRSIWKMLRPFATASRSTPLFYIAIYQVSLLSHAACAIDVHNNDDDNNDNALQRGPLWPH